MRYLYIISTFILLLSAQSIYSQEYMPLYSAESGYITDMVLFYQCGHRNLDYNKERVTRHIYQIDEEGNFKWLYDAFLFLAIRDPKGLHYDGTWGKESATKKEWDWILNKHFEKEKAVSAVNVVLDSLKKIHIEPLRKRKIVISMPNPTPGQKNWGKVGNKNLDFSEEKDRLTAMKWYIDQVIDKWEKGKYDNLELAGFYFFKENSKADESLMPLVGEYVRKKGYTYYWIPYLWAQGYDKTHELGFDASYQQPNYFFKKCNMAPVDRMDYVCRHAKNKKMGMEMEFNDDVQYVFYQMRFIEYLDGFERNGVFDEASVAYYQDSETFYKMSNSDDIIIKGLYNRLCHIIDQRQKKADEIFRSGLFKNK